MVMNAQSAPGRQQRRPLVAVEVRSRRPGWRAERDHAGKVLEAVRLVRQGRVYDLAHVLDQGIPAFPGRTFRQYLTTNYHQISRRHPDAGPAGLGHNSVSRIVE
jgi:hypothetical protein